MRPRIFLAVRDAENPPRPSYTTMLPGQPQEDFRALPQGANRDRRVRAPGTAAPRFMSPLVLPPNMKVSISSSDEPRCAWRAAGALFCRAAEVCLHPL